MPWPRAWAPSPQSLSRCECRGRGLLVPGLLTLTPVARGPSVPTHDTCKSFSRFASAPCLLSPGEALRVPEVPDLVCTISPSPSREGPPRRLLLGTPGPGGERSSPSCSPGFSASRTASRPGPGMSRHRVTRFTCTRLLSGVSGLILSRAQESLCLVAEGRRSLTLWLSRGGPGPEACRPVFVLTFLKG